MADKVKAKLEEINEQVRKAVAESHSFELLTDRTREEIKNTIISVIRPQVIAQLDKLFDDLRIEVHEDDPNKVTISCPKGLVEHMEIALDNVQ